MIFNSVTFLLFLAIVVALYWVLPRRARLWMLFVASLTFYGFWRWEFLPIMLLSAVTDYVVSRRLAVTDHPRHRKLLVLASLVVNLGLLFYFKYLLFFIDNVWTGLALLGIDSTPPELNIILPLGISFYTFQTISYTIDVYRRQIKPLRDFVLYGCYVIFFPQLVAGPILRAGEVVSQLDKRPRFLTEDIAIGTRRVLSGLFLKVVMADNLAPLVDDGFAQEVAGLSALDVWTLAFLFGLQIYFDFSAYSHIAIGCARIMGIRFPENFNFPYLASSPRDFWGRWHISLSSWIRDYLYLPLTGMKFRDKSTGGLSDQVDDQRPIHRNRALFLTWAIMGLWHGANWTFVFWGLYHATCVYGYRFIKPLRAKLSKRTLRLGGWAITFPLMMLSWIPFRCTDLGHTMAMYGKLFQPAEYLWLGMRESYYLIAALVTVLMIAAYLIRQFVLPVLKRHQVSWSLLETATMTVCVALVFVYLRPITQFIYFQF